jgi:hypothetical protein
MELEDSDLEPGYGSAGDNVPDGERHQKANGNEEGRINDTPNVEAASKERMSLPTLDLNFKDKYIVDWDGDKDPACPRNWSLRRKWENLAIVSCLSFLT